MRPTCTRVVLAVGSCLALVLPAGTADLLVGLEFTGSTLHVESPYVPPDTMGAVGPDHIVELINGRYSVYRKTDGTRVRTTTLDEFWIDAGIEVRRFAFDPRVLYDASTGRWFATSAHDGLAPDGSVLIAVSRTADPTEGWDALEVNPDRAGSCWCDFPTLGINADGVFVAVRLVAIEPFDRCSSRVALIVPKQDLLAGASLEPRVSFEDASLALGTPPETGPTPPWPDVSIPDRLESGAEPGNRVPRVRDDRLASEVRVFVRTIGSRDSTQPIVDLDGGGMPAVFLARDTGGTYRFRRFETLGDISFPFLVLETANVPVTPYPAPFFGGRQPSPKAPVDASSGHLSSTVVRRDGVLWGVQAVAAVPRLEGALRWFRIDAETSALLEEGRIEVEGMDFFYPSIAVDEFLDVVIGFNGSSPSDYVGCYAVLGRTREGVTTFGEPVLLQSGVAGYEVIRQANRNRWGDYSATVVDPSDPHVFWTFQEYVSAEDVWSTRITQLIAVPDRWVDRFQTVRQVRQPVVTPND